MTFPCSSLHCAQNHVPCACDDRYSGLCHPFAYPSPYHDLSPYLCHGYDPCLGPCLAHHGASSLANPALAYRSPLAASSLVHQTTPSRVASLSHGFPLPHTVDQLLHHPHSLLVRQHPNPPWWDRATSQRRQDPYHPFQRKQGSHVVRPPAEMAASTQEKALSLVHQENHQTQHPSFPLGHNK